MHCNKEREDQARVIGTDIITVRGDTVSAMIMLHCSIGRTAASGILSDRQTLADLRRQGAQVRCSECSQLHGLNEVHAWLAPL